MFAAFMIDCQSLASEYSDLIDTLLRPSFAQNEHNIAASHF